MTPKVKQQSEIGDVCIDKAFPWGFSNIAWKHLVDVSSASGSMYLLENQLIEYNVGLGTRTHL